MKILYIPGLGEGPVLTFQKKYIGFLNKFRKDKNKIHVFESLWASDETYENKLERLQTTHKNVKPEDIVGPSAGASLAVVLGASHANVTLHVICGKMRRPEKIGATYQKKAPALVDSVTACASKLSSVKNEVVCYAPIGVYDGVVERKDMVIDSQKIVNLPPLYHSLAIGFWLFFYLPRL